MRLLRCAVVVLFVLLGVARADEAAADAQDVAAPEVLPNFSKMRIRELQGLLDERGVSCVACSEKAQLVERVKETFSLPVLEKKEAAPPPAEPAQGDAKAKDPKELEKLLKDLNLGGKGFKVYGRDDIDKMTENLKSGGKFDKDDL